MVMWSCGAAYWLRAWIVEESLIGLACVAGGLLAMYSVMHWELREAVDENNRLLVDQIATRLDADKRKDS